MIHFVFAFFSALRTVFVFFLLWFIVIMALSILQGCSTRPKDKKHHAIMTERTFVSGTTEAIRNFRPGVKSVPSTKH
jgi:hypothetical protein